MVISLSILTFGGCTYSGSTPDAPVPVAAIQISQSKNAQNRPGQSLKEAIVINPKKGWQRGHIPVRVQDQVTLIPTGVWTYSPAIPMHDSGGSGFANMPEKLPAPMIPPGALVVRIKGSDQIRVVSKKTRFLAEHAGALEFRINENDQWLEDNSGTQKVQLFVQGSPLE
jgi:hypothetical protein